MAESQFKLEITARVVDLGHRVIQLQHVVSAGREVSHPLRLIGIVTILFGLALIGNEFRTAQAAAFALKAAGSLPMWLGFAAAGVGLFLVLFARRQIVIRTSDGGRIVVPASNEEQGAAIIARMRLAMEGAGSVPHVLPPQGTAALPIGVGEPAGAMRPGGPPLGLPQQAGPPAMRTPFGGDGGGPSTVPIGRRHEAYANGHAGRPVAAGPPPAHEAAMHGGMPPLQTRAMAPPHLGQPAGAAGAVQPMSLPASALPMPRDEAAHDLAGLMEHVRRADVQHKEALLELLKVVEDYYRGRASREDAVAHWRSFADYTVQYLGDVDGLLVLTERFGRHMLLR